ncbi:hypothetical protein GW17_00029552 [Ensete ventricosum]|nr:hypothetical protein GW17_00029552 [Ensete ventricosum]
MRCHLTSWENDASFPRETSRRLIPAREGEATPCSPIKRRGVASFSCWKTRRHLIPVRGDKASSRCPVPAWGDADFDGTARLQAVRLPKTTFGGCGRNWSTFTLIHIKVHNRLSYRWLEKQAYDDYNMRLRLRCAELDKEPDELEIDPNDLQFYNKDLKPILE